MKKLITLALACALLTSCYESSQNSPEAVGRLVTLYGCCIPTRDSTKSYEITEYMIYKGNYVKATTTDGETIITSTWTIHLY